MDENKELLTPENEEEVKQESDTDTLTQETNDHDYGDAFDDDINNHDYGNAFDDDAQSADGIDGTSGESDVEPETAVAATGKKRLIQVPVIISIAIVAVTVLVLLILKVFFDSSVTGTWVYSFESDIPDYSATYDEASPDSVPMKNVSIDNYYIFDDNGTATFRVGTLSYFGDYSLSTTEDGQAQMTLNIPDVASGLFTYTVTGNLITGKELTLTYTDPNTGEANNTVFKSGKYSEPEIKREDEFNPNDELTGKWTYDDGYNSMSYILGEDGSISIVSDIMGSRSELKGIYSVGDKQIKIKYMNVIEMDIDMDYRFDGDVLYIGDTPLHKDTGSTSDQTNLG